MNNHQKEAKKEEEKRFGRFFFFFVIANFIFVVLVVITLVIMSATEEKTSKGREKTTVKKLEEERREKENKKTEGETTETLLPKLDQGKEEKESLEISKPEPTLISEEDLTKWFRTFPDLKEEEDKDFILWIIKERSKEIENFADPQWVKEKIGTGELGSLEELRNAYREWKEEQKKKKT